MTKSFAILGVSLLAFAAPAAAGSSDPATAATSNAASSDEGGGSTKAKGAEKTYCLTIEPTTGSRMQQRKCMTKAQWEDQGVEIKVKQ